MAEVPKTSESGEVTNSYINGGVDKEVLAPSEVPREDLIQTAVKFLQNPRVRTSPLSQKKLFLEKKGLSEEEIRIAVERSGVRDNEPTQGPGANQAMYPPPAYAHPESAMMPVHHLPPPVPIPPLSRWAKARDLAFTSMIVTGVSYAVYRLIQTYLQPLLFGKTAQEQRLEKLESEVEEIHISVSDSMAEISSTLKAIQTSMSAQLTQPMVHQTDTKAISDLKSDIASLKGLLLNRNQFPPAPATSPMLPLWQRTSSSSLNSHLADQASPSQDSSKQNFVQNEDTFNQEDKMLEESQPLTESNHTGGQEDANEPALEAREDENLQDSLDHQD